VKKSHATAGLGVQELGPADIGAVRGRVDAVVGEYLPDRALADLVAEAGEFALDAAVAPRRVLLSESHDQLTQLSVDRRPADTTSRRLGPVFRDSFAVPSQQCFGCHDPTLA